MENFEKCTVAMLGGPCSHTVYANVTCSEFVLLNLMSHVHIHVCRVAKPLYYTHLVQLNKITAIVVEIVVMGIICSYTWSSMYAMQADSSGLTVSVFGRVIAVAPCVVVLAFTNKLHLGMT